MTQLILGVGMIGILLMKFMMYAKLTQSGEDRLKDQARSNKEIEALKSELTQLNGRQAQYPVLLQGLESRLAGVNKEIEGLGSTNAEKTKELQTQAANLKTAIDAMKDLKTKMEEDLKDLEAQIAAKPENTSGEEESKAPPTKTVVVKEPEPTTNPNPTSDPEPKGRKGSDNGGVQQVLSAGLGMMAAIVGGPFAAILGPLLADRFSFGTDEKTMQTTKFIVETSSKNGSLVELEKQFKELVSSNFGNKAAPITSLDKILSDPNVVKQLGAEKVKAARAALAVAKKEIKPASGTPAK